MAGFDGYTLLCVVCLVSVALNVWLARVVTRAGARIEELQGGSDV